MKPSELAGKMLKSGGNITMVIDNLEKRKLVQRTPHASDRRAIIISLTAAGNKLIESLMPPQVACIKDQMAVLTAGELETLRELTRRLGTAQ
jgi:MarR family 2-MHQ and catechol resistance regulon transcriptional repressor